MAVISLNDFQFHCYITEGKKKFHFLGNAFTVEKRNNYSRVGGRKAEKG